MPCRSTPFTKPKTHLSKLIERAERGEEVRAEGKPHEPVAPVNKRSASLGFAGQIVIHDSFFDPMPEDELREFGEDRAIRWDYPCAGATMKLLLEPHAPISAVRRRLSKDAGYARPPSSLAIA